MPADIFNEFWEAITVIEARQMLTQMTVADYPNLKKPDREKLHRQIYELAHPSIFSNSKEETADMERVGMLLGRAYRG